MSENTKERSDAPRRRLVAAYWMARLRARLTPAPPEAPPPWTQLRLRLPLMNVAPPHAASGVNNSADAGTPGARAGHTLAYNEINHILGADHANEEDSYQRFKN